MSELRRRRKPSRSEEKEDKKEKDKKEDTSQSLVGDNCCVICYQEAEEEEGPLIRPCACADAHSYHYHCIARFIIESYDRPCNVCGQQFIDERITRGRDQLPASIRRFAWIIPGMIRRNADRMHQLAIGLAGAVLAYTAFDLIFLGGGPQPWYIVVFYALLIIYFILHSSWATEPGIITFRDYDDQTREYSRGTTYVFDLDAAIQKRDQEQLEHHQQIMDNQMAIQQNTEAAAAQKFDQHPDQNDEETGGQNDDSFE